MVGSIMLNKALIRNKLHQCGEEGYWPK